MVTEKIAEILKRIRERKQQEQMTAEINLKVKEDAAQEEQKPQEALKVKQEPTNLAYCFKCRKMTTVLSPEIEKREIKSGSLRTFVKGKCEICNSKVYSVLKKAEESQI